MVSKGRRSAVPSAALAFLAPPPLIAGEDHAAYDDLLARISAALQPGDILEDIWVRDVVDMVWDALRLRRLKTQLLTASAYEGMHAILYRFLDWQFSEQVARQWALRDQAAVTKAEAVLASAGLTTESVIAQTLALKIDVIERVDRMVMAEARRNSVLREIERHRASFARTARRVVQDAEDAEEIEGPGCKLIGADKSRARARERGAGVSAARRREADRGDSKASTGPRTTVGKARSARNARRHGLNLPALRDPAWLHEVKALGRAIAGAGAGAYRHELACRVATAQIDFIRARRARLDLLRDGSICDFSGSWQLYQIDRYERRALSRRKFAIRAFDVAAREEAAATARRGREPTGSSSRRGTDPG